MSAYYNEFDPFAAAWLRELIKAGLIANGEVDERSIKDVTGADTRGFAQVHWFAGIGGWSYALRLAGWPDDRPVWTGSCPCQPFSLAGAQKGFDDARHLWPEFKRLIGECRPATVFGEQVASASKWLGLVRGDLEALDYAVGAMPVQAASAGADHLRDRYWFVGHDTRERRGEGRPEHAVRGGRATTAGDGGSINLADAASVRERRSWESRASSQSQVPAGGLRSNSGVALGNATGITKRESDNESDACTVGGEAWRLSCGASFNSDLAHPDQPCTGEGWQQRSGQQRGSGGDKESYSGDISDTQRLGIRGPRPTAAAGAPGGVQGADAQRERIRPDVGPVCDTGEFAWVIGADGKARRVKPGVRLLAHGFPARVGLLRGFGNAIDPRPASAFIKAAMT